MTLSEHPPSFRLDAHAAGDANQAVAQHLEVCERCRAYVAAMAGEVSSFAEHADGSAFIGRIQGKNKKLARIGFVAAPLLAAALVFLVIRAPSSTTRPELVSPPSSERFKGKVQLAVVRDRDGDQKRFATELAVRPGDRIRLEVSVDDARPIVAGVLGSDGSWLVLLTPALLEAGTHFSERSARFDEAPTEGWILAGDPEAVEHARSSKDLSQVAAIAVLREVR